MSKVDPNIELEKLKLEREIFEKESSFKERELTLKESQNKSKIWKNPTYIAVFAAIIGLIGNAAVAYFNNQSQLEIENQKAEAARILEVVKTAGNSDKAAENLDFLLRTGLISKDTSKIRKYLENRKPGEGISLSGNGNFESEKITASNVSTSKEYCQTYLKFGTPSSQTLNFCRVGYSLGFDLEKKLPKWVIYNLSSDKPPIQTRRRDNWQLDPEIPHNFQAGPELYIRNEYDRGHLVKRTDVTWNEQATLEIYVYSVVLPMHQDVNRKTWLQLESLTSEALENAKVNELLIISGPIFGSNTINNYREIADVPDNFYRIVYSSKLNKLAAWIVPNEPVSLPRSEIDLKTYLTSVDRIEELTNLDFFAALSSNDQIALESSVTEYEWLTNE